MKAAQDTQDWNLFRRWTFKATTGVQPCEYAQQFIAWRDEVCQKALASANVILLNQTRLKVATHYYELYVAVPKAHRQCLGSGKHVCIFSIFIETMHLLADHEWRIDKPLLFEPPPPAPPAPIQVIEIPGVTVAEFSNR